jgi:hypothetical protein
MKIAHEKGLPELKHHILPRTKGFILLLQGAENRSKLLIYLSQISDRSKAQNDPFDLSKIATFKLTIRH